MTHRLAQLLLVGVFLGGLFLISAPAAAQYSTQPDKPESSAIKRKSPAPSATDEKSAKDADTAAKTTNSDEGQPAKTEETKTSETKKDTDKTGDDANNAKAKKKEDATPVVESPKLIQVPQDDSTYTPRPKIVAVFVFTNGNRIESDDYLITKDTLFINNNGQKTRYPINTVDRAATKAANESRGVDIVFPKSKSEFNLDF